MTPKFTPEDILVADRSLFPFIYGLKDKYPEFSFKLVDWNGLLDLASFSFAKNPIPQLIVDGFSYPNAKRYVQLLRMGLGEKDAKARAFLDRLGPDAIRVDPLGKYELGAGRIFFLEMKADMELHGLLSRQGFGPIDVTLEELGVDIPQTKREVLIFKNKFAQFSHIFATLREKLLQDPGYAKGCYIQIGGSQDVFYARQLGAIFGIETYYRYRAPLLSETAYMRLYRLLRTRQSIALTDDEKETGEGKIVQSLIEEYRLNELNDEVSLTRLYEILSNRFETRQIGEKGILLSDSFTVFDKKDVYLTCFQDGPFYTCYADDDIFTDIDLSKMGFNPSYVKTALEKRKKELYLRLNRFALVSRVKEHLDEKIYDSPFLKEFSWQALPVPSVKEEGVFTSSASALIRGARLDDSHYPDPFEDLRSYDSKFKGIEGYKVTPKERYSVTNLESFVRCPYAYYLKSILPSTKSDHDIQYLGVFVHKILEGIHEPAWDYESAFAAGVEAYKDEMKKYDETPGPKEEVIFAIVKVNFKRTAAMIRSWDKHSNLVRSYSELKLNWTLQDQEKTYPFYGVADYVGVYQNESMTFFAIADYKTGSEEYLPYGCFLGASTQLPLYAYALTKGESKDKVEGAFGGMGLQHVLPASLKTTFVDKGVFAIKKGYKELRLDGTYLNNEPFWACFDDTAKDNKGYFGGSFAYVGKKTFDASGAGSLSGLEEGRPYSLEDLLQDAIKGTLDTLHKIENGEFDIAPSPRDPRVKEGNLPCEYCPYGDICYKNTKRDARYHKKEVEAYFDKAKGGKADGI